MIIQDRNGDTRRSEVRREDDDELLGFVVESGRAWSSLTMFGGVLGVQATEADAHQQVLTDGLSSLAESWWVDLGAGWERCSLVEASPERLVVVRLHHSFDRTPLVLPPGTEVRLTPPT